MSTDIPITQDRLDLIKGIASSEYPGTYREGDEQKIAEQLKQRGKLFLDGMDIFWEVVEIMSQWRIDRQKCKVCQQERQVHDGTEQHRFV